MCRCAATTIQGVGFVLTSSSQDWTGAQIGNNDSESLLLRQTYRAESSYSFMQPVTIFEMSTSPRSITCLDLLLSKAQNLETV